MGSAIPSHFFQEKRVKKVVSYRTIKSIINKNFTFSDLSPRFKNVDSSTGNIFCPFHENHSTPAAKMYWNENSQLWVIHCFGQCHRNFTAYDYVDLVLCKKYQKYSSPFEFLKKNMPLSDLYFQIEISEKEREDQVDMETSAKVEYIQKIAEENEATEDFIEALYLG